MARSYVSAFLGLGQVGDFSSEEIKEFLEFGNIPTASIGSLIHEATHLHCHSTLFNRIIQKTAIDFLGRRISASLLSSVYGGALLPYSHNSWRLIAFLDLYRPIMEGVAYFAEFDLDWGHLSEFETLSRLNSLFSEEELLEWRSSRKARRRRMDLLSRPILPNVNAYSNSCDTLGYILIKRAFHIREQSTSVDSATFLKDFIQTTLNDPSLYSLLNEEPDIALVKSRLQSQILEYCKVTTHPPPLSVTTEYKLSPRELNFGSENIVCVDLNVSPNFKIVQDENVSPATIEYIFSEAEANVEILVRGNAEAIRSYQSALYNRHTRLLRSCNESANRFYILHAGAVQILNKPFEGKIGSLAFLENENNGRWDRIFRFALDAASWENAGIPEIHSVGRLVGDMSVFVDHAGNRHIEFFLEVLERDGEMSKEDSRAVICLSPNQNRMKIYSNEYKHRVFERNLDDNLDFILGSAPNSITISDGEVLAHAEIVSNIGENIFGFHMVILSIALSSFQRQEVVFSKDVSLLGDSDDDHPIFQFLSAHPTFEKREPDQTDLDEWYSSVPDQYRPRLKELCALLGIETSVFWRD